MLTERLDEQTFHLVMMGFLAVGSLLAIIWALVDNRRAMRSPTVEIDVGAASLGDVTTLSEEIRHLIARRRFERMDGVL